MEFLKVWCPRNSRTHLNNYTCMYIHIYGYVNVKSDQWFLSVSSPGSESREIGHCWLVSVIGSEWKLTPRCLTLTLFHLNYVLFRYNFFIFFSQFLYGFFSCTKITVEFNYVDNFMFICISLGLCIGIYSLLNSRSI